MSDEDPDTCSHCRKPWVKHNLADALTCIYGGAEKKDGGKFGRPDAEETAERILRRLKA